MSKKIRQEWVDGVMVVIISGYDLTDYKVYQSDGMKLVYADRRTLIFVKLFDE